MSVTFAEAGGLMTYAANQADRWRSLATYVDKILKGIKPTGLPVHVADCTANLQVFCR
jgi:ABC-type uncharacterized transport system substrate-binding protein